MPKKASTVGKKKNISQKTSSAKTKTVVKKSSTKSIKNTAPITTARAKVKEPMRLAKTPAMPSFSEALNKKTVIISAVVIALGLAYFFRGQFLAATVNGQPITRIKIMRQAEEAYGTQLLERVVLEVLIEQKAREKGIQVSDEVIDNRIEEIRQMYSEQGQDLDQLLVMQGYSIERLRNDIKMEQLAEMLVGADIEVAQEDVDQYIEENADFLPEDLEGEELEEFVREQLKQQQLNQKYQTWIEELKTEANIEYFGSYVQSEELSL